ncbi:TPA: integrase [Bacillus pseudomycoides]
MNKKETQNTIQGFSSYLSNKGRKPSTIKRYIYDVESFIQWLHQSKKFSNDNTWESLNKQDFKVFFDYLKEGRQRLKQVVSSLEGLTEKQSSTRPMLLERNLSIIILLLDYGLSLQELVSLQMKYVHFESNTLSIPEESKINRTIHLKEEDKLHLYHYYKTIPEPVRPKYHSKDPFFIAFDFTRGTYRWSYDNDAPKFLTEISVQKMIRLEIRRANLRKGISAQHFRNTFVLRKIKQKSNSEQIMLQIGFKSHLSLKRYYDYYKKTKVTTD